MKTIIKILLVIALLFGAYRLVEYPEKYLSTWRYQLKNDIARGNQEAIDYYQTHYLDKGVKLWE